MRLVRDTPELLSSSSSSLSLLLKGSNNGMQHFFSRAKSFVKRGHHTDSADRTCHTRTAEQLSGVCSGGDQPSAEYANKLSMPPPAGPPPAGPPPGKIWLPGWLIIERYDERRPKESTTNMIPSRCMLLVVFTAEGLSKGGALTFLTGSGRRRKYAVAAAGAD